MTAKSWKQGGCHCGAITFEIYVDHDIIAEECNCSICRMTGFTHLIVPKSRFRLLTGEGQLTEYTFNTGVAKHLFCRVCGVKSFYVPRSNSDGYSANLRCMDRDQFHSIEIRKFDGENWEANAEKLAHLTRDDD